MRSEGKFSPVKIAAMFKDWEAGLTTKELMSKYNCGESTTQGYTHQFDAVKKGLPVTGKRVAKENFIKAMQFVGHVQISFSEDEAEEKPQVEEDATEEVNQVPIKDIRLENALYAYVSILENTIRIFKEEMTDRDSLYDFDELIKAASNIAFKYLSMETEIARAKEA